MDCWTKGLHIFLYRILVALLIVKKEFIKAIGSCGSYLDGGANVPFQEAAIPMLEPTKVREEMKALQRHFRDKRDYVIKRLREMGFKIKEIPDSTFYLWLGKPTNSDFVYIPTY